MPTTVWISIPWLTNLRLNPAICLVPHFFITHSVNSKLKLLSILIETFSKVRSNISSHEWADRVESWIFHRIYKLLMLTERAERTENFPITFPQTHTAASIHTFTDSQTLSIDDNLIPSCNHLSLLIQNVKKICSDDSLLTMEIFYGTLAVPRRVSLVHAKLI